MSTLVQPLDLLASQPDLHAERRWRLWRAVVLASSTLVFSGVLGGEMVWDDRMLTDGTAIGGGTSLLKCFTQPFLWHFFRPLVSVSFFVERLLWHGEPLGYHVTNLLLHVAATAVLLQALREAFQSRRKALLGGAFFAVHPVQVGAVAWIGGRTDSLATLWVLLMLWMLVRSARAPAGEAGPWLAYAVFWYNLSIYTKEQCLPLLLLAPMAYRAWRPGGGVRLPRTELYAAIPFAASAVAFVTAGYFLGMPRPSPIPYSGGEITELFGATIAYYSLLIATPTPSLMHRLSLDGFAGDGFLRVAVGYVVLGALLAVLLRWWRHDRPAAWFLTLTPLALLPVSNVVPLPFLVVAPYRAALPWIGVAAALGNVIGGRIDRHCAQPAGTHRAARLLVALTAVLLLWHGSLSAWGSLQWRSETRIFSRFVSYDPASIVAKTVYTYSLERERRYREAAEMEESALHQVFGSDAWRIWSSAERAIQSDPQVLFRARRNQGTHDDPRIWIAGLYAQLANCRMLQGDRVAAEHALEIGDRVWPNHLRIHMGIGYYAAQRGDYGEAARRYQLAVAIDPENAAAHAGLAYAFACQGRWQEAAAEYARAARLDPTNADTRSRLAEAQARARSDASR